MADVWLRSAQRRFEATGDVDDEAAALLARVRAGALSRATLETLADLGHPAALRCSPRIGRRSSSWEMFVRRLGDRDPSLGVRAAAAAARGAVGLMGPGAGAPVPDWSALHGLPGPELGARRALDAAEEWLVCPCEPHARVAGAWSSFPRLEPRGWIDHLCRWTAHLAARTAGHRGVQLWRRGVRPHTVRLQEAARDALAPWLLGRRPETVDQALWLPGDRLLRSPLDCPPIDWHCQMCHHFVRRTIDLFPTDTEDSDCDDHPERSCSTGYSTTMVARCSACGQDLDWGVTLCEHFRA